MQKIVTRWKQKDKEGGGGGDSMKRCIVMALSHVVWNLSTHTDQHMPKCSVRRRKNIKFLYAWLLMTDCNSVNVEWVSVQPFFF